MAKGEHVYDFDVLIIGSGAGGGVAAHMLSRQGKKVAIVEDDTVGGECPNYGCVPTKALLHAAELYRSAERAKDFGIKVSALNFNYATIKKWKDLAVQRTGTSEGEKAFTASGITLIRGRAHFISANEISTGRRRFKAKKFLIATGTSDFIPPIEGLSSTGYITYRDAIDLTKPLKSVFVIGCGAIGCEFAELFATFGAKVEMAEFGSRLLGKEDPEVGELVQAVFENKFGIQVHTNTKVTKVEKQGRKKIIHYEKNGVGHVSKVDEIMVATGRVANVDMGLENTGVKYDRSGIKVNNYLETTAKNIYAAGDVTGIMNFTHVASYQSRIAAHNMFSQKRNRMRAEYNAIPRCVFVSPEAASTGLTEEQIKAKGWKYKVGTSLISVIGRSNTTDEDIGFVKVIASKKGVILGASIVSPSAGEMIHELTLAVANGMNAEDVTHTVHAFPTWSEAVRIACAKIA